MVSQFRKSFDIARIARGVAKYAAKLFYGGIQAVLEINKCPGRPKPLSQFFAADDVRGALNKQLKDLKRLWPQLHFGAVLIQFVGTHTDFIGTEAILGGYGGHKCEEEEVTNSAPRSFGSAS